MDSQNHSIEVKLKNRFDDDYKNFFTLIKKEWKKVLILILCAMIYAFGQTQFLLKAAVVSDGVEAISGTLSYLLPVLKPYLTVLYLALNIPLIIFFWKKIKRTIMVTTIIFLVFNALFGFIFTLEPIDEFLSQELIVLVDQGWVADPITGTTKNVEAGWPVFIYVILTVACCSPSSAVVWKMGSSTGGTDIIAYYFSYKHKKPIGNLLVIVGGIMSFIGILVLFLSNKFISPDFTKGINGFKHFFCPQVFGSCVYIALNAIVIDMIYPKYQKVKMRIDTRFPEKIEEFLKEINFWHPYQIKSSTSGYTKREIFSIESIVFLLESDELASKIKKIAPDAWISVTPVSKIYGRFNYSKID